MSSSRQRGLPALALLALTLPLMEAAQKKGFADPSTPSGAGPREFLADLLSGKCIDPNCEICAAAATSNTGTPTSDMSPADATAPSEPLAPTSGNAAETPQEKVLASGGISQTACRAVRLTDADTGVAAQLKGSAAALVTELEDLRDSMEPGAPDRLTAEGYIGAIAQACSWAISRLPHQAA